MIVLIMIASVVLATGAGVGSTLLIGRARARKQAALPAAPAASATKTRTDRLLETHRQVVRNQHDTFIRSSHRDRARLAEHEKRPLVLLKATRVAPKALQPAPPRVGAADPFESANPFAGESDMAQLVSAQRNFQGKNLSEIAQEVHKQYRAASLAGLRRCMQCSGMREPREMIDLTCTYCLERWGRNA